MCFLPKIIVLSVLVLAHGHVDVVQQLSPTTPTQPCSDIETSVFTDAIYALKKAGHTTEGYSQGAEVGCADANRLTFTLAGTATKVSFCSIQSFQTHCCTACRPVPHPIERLNSEGEGGRLSKNDATRFPDPPAEKPACNRNSDAILIFTYGKVGSTSLKDFFGGANYRIQNGSLRMQQGSSLVTVQDFGRVAHVHGGEVAKKFIDYHTGRGTHVCVLTSVRNRFTRDPSAFFESSVSIMGSEKEVLAAPLTTLQEEFSLFLTSASTRWADRWFENDFRQVLPDSDIPAEFLTSDASLLGNIQGGTRRVFIAHALGLQKISLAVMRCEDSEDWPELLKHFVEYRNTKSYTGASKWYASKYKAFKHELQFTDEEICAVKRGETYKFYTELENAQLLMKATKRSKWPECGDNKPEETM